MVIIDQRTFARYLLCLWGGPATPSIITFALNDSIHYMNWGTGTKEKKEYSEILLKSFLLFTSKFKGFHKAELKIDWKLCCSTNLLKKGFFNEAFEVNHSFDPITSNKTNIVVFVDCFLHIENRLDCSGYLILLYIIYEVPNCEFISKIEANIGNPRFISIIEYVL